MAERKVRKTAGKTAANTTKRTATKTTAKTAAKRTTMGLLHLRGKFGIIVFLRFLLCCFLKKLFAHGT